MDGKKHLGLVLNWAWNIFLMLGTSVSNLETGCCSHRILSCSGHYGTLKIRLQDTSNWHRYTISWTGCKQAWKTCIKQCRNTAGNNFHMGRIGGCSNVYETLKSCAKVTSKWRQRTVLTLQALHMLGIIKSHCFLKYSTKQSFQSVHILLGLWKVVPRSLPGYNIQYLFQEQYNLLSSCKMAWEKEQITSSELQVNSNSSLSRLRTS